MNVTYENFIEAGSATYLFRALVENLMIAINKDKDLKQPLLYFGLYLNIIFLTASGFGNLGRNLYLINRPNPSGLSEEEFNFHISRVKSDYGEFVESMAKIIDWKLSDFIKLGASKKEADDCVDDWIRSEIMRNIQI